MPVAAALAALLASASAFAQPTYNVDLRISGGTRGFNERYKQRDGIIGNFRNPHQVFLVRVANVGARTLSGTIYVEIMITGGPPTRKNLTVTISGHGPHQIHGGGLGRNLPFSLLPGRMAVFPVHLRSGDWVPLNFRVSGRIRNANF